MKTKYFLAISLILMLFGNSVFAKDDFNSFWKKFKSAVVNGDKNAVAGMTKFPLSMPYGVKSIKSKAYFLKHYDEIMNHEANAKRCFKVAKLEKYEKYYEIGCTFKQNDESSEDRPISYIFEKTKSGWKFVGIDNINE
jgi:hypothetical protein